MNIFLNEYFGFCFELIFFWMNILDFVLNWILNWIIFRQNSMKKWILETYRTGLPPINPPCYHWVNAHRVFDKYVEDQTFPASPSGKHQRETGRLQAQHWSAFWIPTFHLFDFWKTSVDYLLSVKVALSLRPQIQHSSYEGETTFGKADVPKWDNKEMGKEQQIRTER